MSILLDVKNLGISFGGLRAVNEFDLTIQKEQLYGLIGPNGAGKTTVFNLLTGVYKPDAGKVILDGKDITGERNIEISKAGIARTFQNIRLFKQLSVLDNVKAGLHNHHPYSTLSGILRLPSYRKVEKEMDDRAMELLKVFDLEKYADHQAANLPYGQQRKLEIARALATDPKLLLLDEPTAALDAIAENEMYEKYNEMLTGKTALFISHRLASTRFCDHILFLENGKITEEGTHEELMQENGGYAEMFLVQSRYYKEEGAQSHEEDMAGI